MNTAWNIELSSRPAMPLHIINRDSTYNQFCYITYFTFTLHSSVLLSQTIWSRSRGRSTGHNRTDIPNNLSFKLHAQPTPQTINQCLSWCLLREICLFKLLTVECFTFIVCFGINADRFVQQNGLHIYSWFNMKFSKVERDNNFISYDVCLNLSLGKLVDMLPK